MGSTSKKTSTPKERAVPTATANRPAAIVTDDAIPSDHLMLAGIKTPEPVFSVSEVAKVFFKKTAYWIRWQEDRGFFTLDGKSVGTTRTTTTGDKRYAHRRYTLADVEKMAHALAQKGALPSHELRMTLRIVEAVARIYGYLDTE